MPDDVDPGPGPATGGGGGGLSQKVGPLPVWGWFLVAAGVLGVFLIWRRSQGNASSTNAITGGLPNLNAGSGVTSVDPLTGEQLLTQLQQLVTTLQSQQTQTGTSANQNSLQLPFNTGDVSITSAGNVISVFGNQNAAWVNGSIAQFNPNFSPEELYAWLSTLFAFYNLSGLPDVGTMIYYDPSGGAHRTTFRKPGTTSFPLQPGINNSFTNGLGSMVHPAMDRISALPAAPPALLAPTMGPGSHLARATARGPGGGI